MGNVGRDGARRPLAERGKAGPVVDVDQDGPVGLRERDVAAEHFESENRRRLEGERLEAILIHQGTLAGEPRIRPVPIEKPAVGHAVKLHYRPGHVLLQRHPGNAAGGEGPQRLSQTVQRRRDHILRTLSVYVAALDPDLLVIGTEGAEVGGRRERRGAGEDERAGKRQRDRKSTRLNSSHTVISYAVFCLKKKNHESSCRLQSRWGHVGGLPREPSAVRRRWSWYVVRCRSCRSSDSAVYREHSSIPHVSSP